MAFKVYSVTDGTSPAWEWKPAAIGTYVQGLACVNVTGYMTTVSSGVGQDTDEGAHWICVANQVVAVAGTMLPFIKASNDQVVWETTLSAEDADIAVGLKYCIYTDGLQHDGSVTKGVFEVSYFAGTALGSIVRGRFVE